MVTEGIAAFELSSQGIGYGVGASPDSTRRHPNPPTVPDEIYAALGCRTRPAAAGPAGTKLAGDRFRVSCHDGGRTVTDSVYLNG